MSPFSRAAELVGLKKFRKYDIQIAGVTSKGAGIKSPNMMTITAEDSMSTFIY